MLPREPWRSARGFVSAEDLREAPERGLGPRDLGAPAPLGGSLEGLREAAWLGEACRMVTALPLGTKSLTWKPESFESCQRSGTTALPCPAVLPSILLLQTQPKGPQQAQPHLHHAPCACRMSGRLFLGQKVWFPAGIWRAAAVGGREPRTTSCLKGLHQPQPCAHTPRTRRRSSSACPQG